MFKKAERKQSRLRLCISGPSGAGKTEGALTIATSLKGGGKIAVIDTENGSASLYADRFEFDVLNLDPPYSPKRFVEAIKNASDSGYTVIIIDSATHEWDGEGGCLDMNEQTARSKFKGNTWSAWSDTTKEHQKFINAIVHSNSHVICTARSKTETAQEGKRIMRLGTKLVQRDNFEYEFTVALDLIHDCHIATAIKDRTSIFSSRQPEPITSETGDLLLNWLNSGKSLNDSLLSYIADIAKMQTIDELTPLFASAWTDIKSFNDDASLSKLKGAYDKQKESIENKNKGGV